MPRRCLAMVAVVTTGVALAIVSPGLVLTWLYDNRPSGVAYAELPTRAEVEAAMAAHRDLVRRIKGLGDQVEVFVDEPCDDRPGAAELVLIHPGAGRRESIEAILAEESFGVPTALRNV